MINVTRLHTACKVWTSLEAVHESKGHKYAITIMCALFRTCAEEGDDLIEHLNKLKEMWEKLNILNNDHFKVLDMQFKTIITSFLPQSWDIFTNPYVGGRGTADRDSKDFIQSQEFIGILTVGIAPSLWLIS